MRFSVDAHAIGRHLTGNEVYIRNLLNGFAALDKSSEFIAYLSSEDAREYVPQRFTTRRVALNPFVRLGYDLTRRLRNDRPNLVHVQYTAPLFCPVPIVVSVHDVSYLECPDFFPKTRAFQLRCTVEHTVRSASRVLCPSDFSKRAIVRAYGLNEDKVVVVPNAVSSAFRPISRETALHQIQKRLDFSAPYILTVGDLQPRKNQIGLIRAFGDLLRSSPNLPHHLVLVGKQSWFGGNVRKAAERSPFSDRIHFTGWVSDAELLQFYGGCDLFVFPSFYEGFGLPILEAMACSRAVACSNSSAMPEVADSCALLFDPNSTAEMTRAMRDLLLNPELRVRMERLGLQRSALFNWSKTAQRTLDLYYKVAGQSRRAVQRKSVPVTRS